MGKQPGELEPGGAGLVAGSQPAGVTEAGDEPAQRRLVVGNPVDLGGLLVWGEDPHRDRVAVDVQPQVDWGEEGETLLATAGSFRTVAPPAHRG